MKKRGNKQTMEANRYDFVSRLYPVGTMVVGWRGNENSPETKKFYGRVVRTYFTLNESYKNYSYRVRCSDGKCRSFMCVRSV